MKKRIGVLGCGNMAQAIILNMYKTFKDVEFYTYTPSLIRSIELSKKVSGVHCPNLSDLPDDLDLYLIACKPQQVKELGIALNGKLRNKEIISVLAGTSIESLSFIFSSEKICRVMPNTPSLYGQGIELVLFSSEFKEKKTVETLFKSCGDVYLLNSEEELDLLTVYSGSGPAYVFYLAKSLEQDLINRGFSKGFAKKIISQLFIGSSKLIEESNSSTSFSALVDSVTSKAGVTIEAINTFDEQNFPSILTLALNNALKRGEELRNQTI